MASLRIEVHGWATFAVSADRKSAGAGEFLTLIHQDVSQIKNDVGGMKADVAGLTTDMAGVKADVAGLTTDMAGVKADVAGLTTATDEHTQILAEHGQMLREILGRLA